MELKVQIVLASPERASRKLAVSLTTATPGRTQDEHLAQRRRFQLAKVAGASLLALALFYAGQRGRQQVNLQIRLDQITLACDRLQRQLEDEQRIADPLTNPPASSSRVAESL